ncbi:MAG: hypothetical protein WC750_06115 [Patescibacteria group bacterium]|jgi:hypothetical protein
MPESHFALADRLTLDERVKIYKLAGEGYTVAEITRLFNMSQPKDARSTRIPGIHKILQLPEAHRYVSKFRMEFLKTVKDIPISQKAVRLDDLERLRQRLMNLINNCQLNRSHPKDISLFMAASRRVIEIMEIARNEMEQHPGLSIGIGLTQGDLSDLSDSDLQGKRDELLRRAAATLNRRASGVDEVAEGDEGAAEVRSATVFLAPSEELPRAGALPGSGADVPDVRQQESGDQGVPAV